ncbi:MAG: hypothetical protein LBB15_01870 [Puniceicoccales bacterium]|jgi:hypothetical protein|nr:hypothetical protein [Puniceicoccales bacterium]
MLKNFLVILLVVYSVNYASGESLSKFGVVNKKFSKAKILNKNIKCFSLAEKGKICVDTANKHQLSKSCRHRWKIAEIHVNQK